MNINVIREKIESNLGKEVFIRYNLGRNKIEKYNAKIKEIYNYVFVVEVLNTNEVKSFTYSDIITNTIKVYYK
ncbi:MAG: Veg family protein [Bacilli bacterium]|nr:Veg family protein [Bacilli bacterium]